MHALEPLLYAFKPEQILMIHEPAVCLGALWVPYRRDSNVMRAVLQQGADTPGVSMIFCHADVRGAYMNDNMRSKEGLDIEAFPKDIPIYSGHFHKPHTVRTVVTPAPAASCCLTIPLHLFFTDHQGRFNASLRGLTISDFSLGGWSGQVLLLRAARSSQGFEHEQIGHSREFRGTGSRNVERGGEMDGQHRQQNYQGTVFVLKGH